MSSQVPLDDCKKLGILQTIQNSFQLAKNSVKRRASSRQLAGQLQEPITLGPKYKPQSLLNRSAPALITGLLPLGPDRPKDGSPPRGVAKRSFSTAAVGAGPERPKAENVTWSRLTKSLCKLESSVELFPPLRATLGALIGSLDIVQAVASNRQDFEELVKELESMTKILIQEAEELAAEPSKGSIANISQCIERQVANIKRKVDRGTMGRILDAAQDQEDMIRQYRQIERLFRQLQCDLTMRTKDISKKQFETTLLRGILPVDDARYNSSYSTIVKRRGCTPETRKAIHQALQDWATGSSSEKIYWMNGMAGTGKTTIAYTFCEWLESTNRLGASFFCSRISSSCRSLSQIVPTIAYQLAHFSPAFRAKLCSALNDNPDAGKLNVTQQFEALINRPISSAKSAIPDSVIIVIDALDECDDSYSVLLLLDVLLKFADQLPLKFFVSSRPEHVIRERMLSQGGSTRAIVHLHDIEQSIVEEDIKKYLSTAFSSMSPPPSGKQIGLLAKRSRNLFIYAATVVRFIHPEDFPVDSAKRLESMLEAISDPRAMAKNKYEDLDCLYTTVLSAVFHSRLQDDEQECMRHVLWTIVCAKEPMTSTTIASLANLEERQVWSALQSLRSVVHVSEKHSLISPLHASFPEYMLDRARSKQFYCDESQSNKRLVHRFFEIMKLELRFNICDLKSSYVQDNQIEDLEARVTRHISPTLSYSCRYWSTHLLLVRSSVNTRDMLSDFLSNRLLFWMEALSLCRCIGIAAPMLQEVQTWLRIHDASDDIQKQVSDARNFVTWFAANPCSRSTPHIYISALPCCAKSNWVYEHYSKRTQGLMNIKKSQRDEAVLAIWRVESAVVSMIISPDGSRVAAGTSTGSIQLYDTNTGAIVAAFKGHADSVWSVAFSPDGSLIASGSQDGTVIIWDIHTGRIVTGPLRQQTGQVMSVAFSPDGKYLVSGSGDSAVRVWEVSSGSIILGPLRGHSGAIRSVTFSPNGRYIASSSEDSTIRLWNAFTGEMITEPLIGHTDIVHKVVFSLNGSLLASCSSDRTIRIWDVSTGTLIGRPLKGDKGGITSLAFSPDGTKLVSGDDSGDPRIIVWDVQTCSPIIGPLRGHTSVIRSVSFSPDSTRVLSGSGDCTIRIWDVLRKRTSPGEHHSRETSVGPIAFSPDRTRFISASSSGELHVCDIRIGTTVPLTLEGNEDLGPISFIAFSPQGPHIAAAIAREIHVWNILTGSVASWPLMGHTDSIRCLVFSPDGASICSGSDDSTVIVWDIRTSAMVGQPYRGHTGAVRSVTYSSSGTLIASGATDKTIRVWDSTTGKLVHELSGHSGSVESVAFSPDGRYIISGGVDCRIQKWNVDSPVESVEYDCEYPVNSVAFSADGNRIIAGSDSTIWMFNRHLAQSLCWLSVPEGEKVSWVGFSPESNDILSSSVSEKQYIHQPTKEADQRSSYHPNIIRVWKTAAQLDPEDFTFVSDSWSLERDGRVISPDGFVHWVSPDLLRYLGRGSPSSTYCNPFVLLPEGMIDIQYTDLCIGESWAECYTYTG